MTDALTSAPEAPQTDTLVEQVDIPNPLTNKIPAEEAPEPKAEAKNSPEKRRASAVDDAVGKVLDAKAEKASDEKVEPAKAEKSAESVKDEPKTEAAPKVEIPKADAQEEAPKAEAKPSAYKDAPNGFDDAAKKEWDATPEGVRGAVHRRLAEQDRGIEKYRQEVAKFDPIKKYVEMAEQGGTSLDAALHKYTNMENQLRTDPIGGLQAVVANLGLKKPDGTPVTLRDVAAKILNQTPDQAASQQEATISKLTQTISQLQQQIGGFSQHVERQQEQARTSGAETEWNNFQRDNPRAAELEPKMVDFLNRYPTDKLSAWDRLNDAYKWAEAQSPSVAHTDPKPLVQTQTPPVAANPAGQKSISGVGGSQKTISRKLSLKDSVASALRKHGL